MRHASVNAFGGSNVVCSSMAHRRRAVGASSMVAHATKTPYPPAQQVAQLPTEAPTDIEYDAVIIGSGMGGLATAAQLVAKGAKVVVLEK
jgi:prolycopene isomerase